jgi:hypothetical protein
MNRQLLLVLFCTGTALLSASGQTKWSDSEMKEVYGLVLEREVQRPADGMTVAVLLGPNVKSNWIPGEKEHRYWMAFLTSSRLKFLCIKSNSPNDEL